MLKKLRMLLLNSSALFLIGVATTTISIASVSLHGEPDCPKELLK